MIRNQNAQQMSRDEMLRRHVAFRDEMLRRHVAFRDDMLRRHVAFRDEMLRRREQSDFSNGRKTD